MFFKIKHCSLFFLNEIIVFLFFYHLSSQVLDFPFLKNSITFIGVTPNKSREDTSLNNEITVNDTWCTGSTLLLEKMQMELDRVFSSVSRSLIFSLRFWIKLTACIISMLSLLAGGCILFSNCSYMTAYWYLSLPMESTFNDHRESAMRCWWVWL